MKKKWALLLVAALALQPLSALTVNAEAAVTDVYADVYGIEVDFNEAPEAADLADLTLLKGDSEEEVTVDWATGETGTKRTINVALDTDTKYKLSFGTTEKTFQIKTVFEETFDDTQKFADQNISDSEASKFENGYGTFEISYGTNGAFIKDGRVWVTDGALSVTALDTNLDYADATITADIKGYAKNFMGGRGGTTLTVPTNLNSVQTYMFQRADAIAPVYNSNAVGVWLKESSYYVAKTNNTTFGIADTTCSDSGYTYNEGTFGFGMFTKYESDNTTKLSHIVNKDSTILNDAIQRTVATRANGKYITGFVYGLGTTVEITATSPKLTKGYFSILGDTETVASIDNVKITIYTEDVDSAISGTLLVEDISYDFDKIVLSFNESIAEVGPVSRGKVEVYQDSATEPMTLTSVSADTEDSKKLVIVPEGYTADHDYTVVVPEGFGTPTLKTDTDWTETFTLQSQPIAVEKAEFTEEGILFTFDTDLTDLVDQAQLDALVLEIDTAAVATADRTITKDAKTLLVLPADYTIGKVYALTIPAGFGTANIYLAADYPFNETFTQIPMNVVEYTGNTGHIQVEFDTVLQPTTNVSGIEIRNAADEVVASTASITTDGKLKVQIPTMERDKVYEIFIPQGFGSEAVATQDNIIQRFEQKTIAFEDFQGTEASFGFNSAPKTQAVVNDATDSTNKMAVVGSSQTLDIPNIKEYENYTFEFDNGLFYSIGESRTTGNCDRAGRYDIATITFNSLRFNYSSGEAAGTVKNWTKLAIREYAVQYQETNGNNSSTTVTSSFPFTMHGDMWKEGGYKIYAYGEALPEDLTHLKSDGTRVLTSEREPIPLTNYKIVKNGADFTVYRNGELKITKTATIATQTTGDIYYDAQGYSREVWDNIRISVFTTVGGEDVVAQTLTLDSALTGTTVTGSFTLKNYSDQTKPVRAIVVAYGEDSEMLCANMISTTQLAPGEAIRNIAFDLDNLDSRAQTVKLFLWDDVAHRTQIKNLTFPTE